jgi:hypothetical protein
MESSSGTLCNKGIQRLGAAIARGCQHATIVLAWSPGHISSITNAPGTDLARATSVRQAVNTLGAHDNLMASHEGRGTGEILQEGARRGRQLMFGVLTLATTSLHLSG